MNIPALDLSNSDCTEPDVLPLCFSERGVLLRDGAGGEVFPAGGGGGLPADRHAEVRDCGAGGVLRQGGAGLQGRGPLSSLLTPKINQFLVANSNSSNSCSLSVTPSLGNAL